MNIAINIPQAPQAPVNGLCVRWKWLFTPPHIALASLYVGLLANASIVAFSIIKSPLLEDNADDWMIAKLATNVIFGGTLPLTVITGITSHFSRRRQDSSTATQNRILAALSIQLSYNTVSGLVLTFSPCTNYLNSKFGEYPICQDMAMTGVYLTITTMALNILGMIYAGCIMPTLESRE